jgi:hypothetical protein
MAARALSIDAAGELVAKIRELRDLRKVMLAALQKTADIVEGEIAIMVDSGCVKDGDGHAILSTLNDEFKPDFELQESSVPGAKGNQESHRQESRHDLIRSMNPYRTAAFNRSVIAASPMTPDEIRRQEQVQDIIDFWNHEHRERHQAARGFLNAIVFTLLAGIAFFVGCCL